MLEARLRLRHQDLGSMQEASSIHTCNVQDRVQGLLQPGQSNSIIAFRSIRRCYGQGSPCLRQLRARHCLLVRCDHWLHRKVQLRRRRNYRLARVLVCLSNSNSNIIFSNNPKVPLLACRSAEPPRVRCLLASRSAERRFLQLASRCHPLRLRATLVSRQGRLWVKMICSRSLRKHKHRHRNLSNSFLVSSRNLPRFLFW